MGQTCRGSRKHILDWVEQSTFPEEFTALLAPTGAVVDRKNYWMPIGYSDPKEARLEQFGPNYLPELIDWDTLSEWWLVNKKNANTPNWDLLSTCSIEGKQGLVLVEAKANVPELKIEGKPLDSNASTRSRQNHNRIGEAIEEARTALNTMFPGVKISRDTHYQLSNRIAFSWKLASMGVPVVLVYLGFIGDLGIADVGKPFDNATHWEAVFGSHTIDLLPPPLVGTRVTCGKSAMQIFGCSRPVLAQSLNR